MRPPAMLASSTLGSADAVVEPTAPEFLQFGRRPCLPQQFMRTLSKWLRHHLLFPSLATSICSHVLVKLGRGAKAFVCLDCSLALVSCLIQPRRSRCVQCARGAGTWAPPDAVSDSEDDEEVADIDQILTPAHHLARA